MSELLSQSQIDELMLELLAEKQEKKTSLPQSNEKKIRTYDFKRPKKFSKEQLKLLKSIYDNFARHLAGYLSGVLRTYCQITVETIEEQPFFEYNNALPDSVFMGCFDLKPFEGNFLVDFSNSVAYSMIERLLGGNGSSPTPERAFTEIEITLMERILKQIAFSTRESWGIYTEIDPGLTKTVTNSRLMQSISMEETVAIIIMEIDIKTAKGSLSICIPNEALGPLIEIAGRSLYRVKRKTEDSKDAQRKEAIISHLKGTSIEAVAVFGDTSLSLSEVIHLQVGDVIQLNQTVDSPVKIYIGDNMRYHGIPGIVKNKKHIKITDVL